MRRSYIPLAAAFLVFVASYSHVYGQAPRPELHVELSKVVGYLKGQCYTLNRIKKEFPELALSAQKAESEFNLSFGAGGSVARIGCEL